MFIKLNVQTFNLKLSSFHLQDFAVQFGEAVFAVDPKDND